MPCHFIKHILRGSIVGKFIMELLQDSTTYELNKPEKSRPKQLEKTNHKNTITKTTSKRLYCNEIELHTQRLQRHNNSNWSGLSAKTTNAWNSFFNMTVRL